jgi:hypothetical protein
MKYYIHGTLVNGLISTSLASLLVSSCLCLQVANYLKIKHAFFTRTYIALSLCAIIDGAIMSIFLMSQFNANIISLIFYKELLCKCVYSFAMSITPFIYQLTLRKLALHQKNQTKQVDLGTPASKLSV